MYPPNAHLNSAATVPREYASTAAFKAAAVSAHAASGWDTNVLYSSETSTHASLISPSSGKQCAAMFATIAVCVSHTSLDGTERYPKVLPNCWHSTRARRGLVVGVVVTVMVLVPVVVGVVIAHS